MSLWRYFFPKISEVTPNTYWLHESELEEARNPFEDTYLTYKVIDVKNGYFKYQYASKKSRIPYLENSCKIENFYAFHRKVDKPDWFE
jgi:hypothetical protein